MPRIWLRKLAALWVALLVALAGHVGPAHPSTGFCGDGNATIDRCGHDRGHQGTTFTCADHCRAASVAALEEPAPPPAPIPPAALRPAPAEVLAGLGWDVPVRPPKPVG